MPFSSYFLNIVKIEGVSYYIKWDHWKGIKLSGSAKILSGDFVEHAQIVKWWEA